MKIKFKNGSSIEIIEDNNETKRGKRGQPSYFNVIPLKYLLDMYMYGIELHWYQRWYLRLLYSKMVRWVYRFKRYGR